ncbi:hypothetical protein TH61_01525 [Rufibacter sp. DG15C]|uniref:hypothetical protein n=1 Tax=Rufibacter sp. DG15C TaxID=1379909 RepID=UPI00078D11F9|nr:hypothetical protein [Rufibacter sp. DG15C]AMM50119.1 hypothetical protein TH61_01525 [Rufibacter sp. DG15C]
MKHIHLLSTDFLNLEYNAVDDILISTWKGNLSNAEIKQGYESISLHLKKNFCHKLLDNHKDVRGLWAELADWVALDWYPRAKAAGLEYHACIYSTNTFSHLSTEKAIEMMQQTGIAQGFEDATAAENWLKSF